MFFASNLVVANAQTDGGAAVIYGYTDTVARRLADGVRCRRRNGMAAIGISGGVPGSRPPIAAIGIYANAGACGGYLITTHDCHACEGRHPSSFRGVDSRPRGNDKSKIFIKEQLYYYNETSVSSLIEERRLR